MDGFENSRWLYCDCDPIIEGSRYKLSQQLKWKIISFLAEYVHAKMASRKRETYQIEPISYVLNWTINAKLL